MPRIVAIRSASIGRSAIMKARATAALSRRTFMGAAGAGLALTALERRLAASPVPASDQIVMGMIGVGSQGTGRLREFMKHDDVRVAAICDVDKRHLDRAIADVEKAKGYKPQAFGDFRRVLDMKEINAVTVVTPD